MSSAIKIENLSKKYIIGHQRNEAYATFRDVLAHKFRGVGQRLRHPLSPNPEEIRQEELWALRNINLEIQPGERVGIIGRNGAGKSTLLKVLSRITEPTEGKFTMRGRVASLLEVGTGFHPELSGRENIYLNGAILGMSKAEIKRKFDEIVAFAETEKFLDTPVKRYSSGMYVRLAFSVAAHLEPEILIVDEVLAVGDAVFQKKCLGRMKEVSSEGRTVLFVSHNIGAINSLCNSVLLLDKGEMVEFGEAGRVVSRYVLDTGKSTGCEFISNAKDIEKGKAQLLEARVEGPDGLPAQTLFVDQESAINIMWRLNEKVSYMRAGIEVVNSAGAVVFSTMDTDSTGWFKRVREPGVFNETVSLPRFLLMPGQYSVNVFAGMPSVERLFTMENVIRFEVVDNQSHLSHVVGEMRSGCIALPMLWQIRFSPSSEADEIE